MMDENSAKKHQRMPASKFTCNTKKAPPYQDEKVERHS